MLCSVGLIHTCPLLEMAMEGNEKRLKGAIIIIRRTLCWKKVIAVILAMKEFDQELVSNLFDDCVS